MQYVSTRGSAPTLDFEGVTLAGLASDGGLYLPAEWPHLSPDEIRGLRGLPYPRLAARIMQPFVAGSLTEAELLAVCEAVYGQFGHAAVAPLVQLDATHWLLELFHGPTLAFKDVALQLLGHLFEIFLERRDQRLTIVGATSGDTGSAAIQAVAGRTRSESRRIVTLASRPTHTVKRASCPSTCRCTAPVGRVIAIESVRTIA